VISSPTLALNDHTRFTDVSLRNVQSVPVFEREVRV